MDEKRNPVTTKVREFKRRPNAEFGKVMGDVEKTKRYSIKKRVVFNKLD